MTIYGGMRTTGANPGHTPRPITFPPWTRTDPITVQRRSRTEAYA